MHDAPDEREVSVPVRAEHDVPVRAEHDVPVRAEHDAATAWPAEQATRERLRAVEDAPLDEHVEVYEDVHRRLQEGLADLDEG